EWRHRVERAHCAEEGRVHRDGGVEDAESAADNGLRGGTVGKAEARTEVVLVGTDRPRISVHARELNAAAKIETWNLDGQRRVRIEAVALAVVSFGVGSLQFIADSK